ncbi:MAG TPA: histone deacetylase [Terriglobia bacterium]|nr:histone deacetylase [Terriglobia bacterium]
MPRLALISCVVLLGLACSAAGFQVPPTQTGLLFDDVYLRHLAGVDHPERPERLTAIWAGLEQAGLIKDLIRIAPRRVTTEELLLVHSQEYIDLVRRELANLKAPGELSTGDTAISPGSFETAQFAAGGVLNAVEAVMTRKTRNAFCAVRPPGHHATPSRGMGFCIYNHVAIAARYAQKMHGVRRVLIVDWDYHHGNGTQDIFYEDESVLVFDTHHYGAYPGTGSPEETGAGKAKGTKFNLAMPAGAGDTQFLEAFKTRLVPEARRFKPDLILISAGFDGMRNDVLGRFDITPRGFTEMTRVVVDLANELCQGRLVSVLEGGYRLDGLSESVAAHVRVLQGR